MAPPKTVGPPGRVDVVTAIRGASTGFGILIVGPLLAQLTAAFLPPPAVLALKGFSVILAFCLAARKIGSSTMPALHGAVAAVLAYVLVLPLQWHLSRPHPSLVEIVFTLAAAALVGAVTSWIVSRQTKEVA